MKLLSFVTLTALLSLASCSHHQKSCCKAKDQASCSKEQCMKKCCDNKDKKCADGSCEKPKTTESDCSGDSCHKKSKT